MRSITPIVKFLTFAMLVILLAGCRPLAPPETPTATEQAGAMPGVPTAGASGASAENLYQDPQERFTVPIPTNWEAEQADGYAVLRSPNDGINVYVMARPADDLEEAVQEAWQTVDPTFSLEPDQIREEPAPDVARAITAIYAQDDDDRVVVATARLHEGIAYMALVRGDLVNVQQRASQMQIVLSGLDILAIEETSLVGVDPQPVSPEVLGAVASYIEEAMAEFGIPGVAVAVVQGDEIVYTGGFGVRDGESGAPITPETRMMIGSTSKTMTTMLLAMMVDQGEFDWDTPVVEILPSFAVADPEITQEITVQNLVCACTGVPRRDMEIFFNFDQLTAEGIIESLETFQFFTDFGEAFQYSNQMVATAGYVAAAAAGGEYGNLYDAYADLVRQRILSPIGMERTTLDFATVLRGDNYATPHELALDGGYTPIPMDWERFVIPLAPAGAYWSTAEDMGRYLITELNRGVTPDGERIVSAANLTHTWESQIAIDANAAYALGWIVSDFKGQRVIAHGGNTIGFTSELAFLPEAGIGISVITNAWGTNAFNEAVRGRLLEILFLQDAQADDAAAFSMETVRAQIDELAATVGETVDPATVEPFLGRHENEALGVITLTLEDGVLRMDAGEFVAEIRPTVNDAGAVDGYILYDSPLAGTNVDLVIDDDGNPVVVIGQGVVEYQFSPLTTVDNTVAGQGETD